MCLVTSGFLREGSRASTASNYAKVKGTKRRTWVRETNPPTLQTLSVIIHKSLKPPTSKCLREGCRTTRNPPRLLSQATLKPQTFLHISWLEPRRTLYAMMGSLCLCDGRCRLGSLKLVSVCYSESPTNAPPKLEQSLDLKRFKAPVQDILIFSKHHHDEIM